MEEDITQGNRTEYAEHLRLNIPYGLSPRSSSIFEPLSIVSSKDDYRPSISASDSYEMSDMERSIRLTPSTSPRPPFLVLRALVIAWRLVITSETSPQAQTIHHLRTCIRMLWIALDVLRWLFRSRALGRDVE